jgi:peptidoglycan/LPS O-acetylase OafA/YrhL
LALAHAGQFRSFAALHSVTPTASTPPVPPAPGYVAVLDPLRGLAALAVAVFHFTNNGWLPATHWLERLGFHGYHGVQTFFVISGFVVPYAMHLGGYSPRNFLPFIARRLARIYPPYFVSVVLLGAMNLMQPAIGAHRLSALDFASHLLFLNELLGRPWLMEIYWTLALEVQFYLLAGLLWPLLSSRATWLFACGAAAAVALGFAWPCNYCLVGTIEYFLLGIALFRQHARMDRPAASAMLITALAGVVWWNDGGISVFAALLPVAAKFAIREVSAPAKFLGRISYSLYLFHLSAGTIFFSLLTPFVIAPSWRSLAIVPALAMSVLAAWLAYLCVEAPAIRWSKKFRYRTSSAA